MKLIGNTLPITSPHVSVFIGYPRDAACGLGSACLSEGGFLTDFWITPRFQDILLPEFVADELEKQ